MQERQRKPDKDPEDGSRAQIDQQPGRVGPSLFAAGELPRADARGPGGVIVLQRAAGNRAVTRLISDSAGRDQQPSRGPPASAASVATVRESVGSTDDRGSLAAPSCAGCGRPRPVHRASLPLPTVELQRSPDAGGGTQGEAELDLPTAIGYVGLNPKAWREAKGLKKKALDKVLVSLDDPAKAKKLDSPEGRTAFLLNELGIDPLRQILKFVRAWSVIEGADPNAREQIAALMEMFAGAEKGKYRLERMVFSGHSNGVEFWGDEEGEAKPGIIVLDRDMAGIVGTFPKAAAQVEDVMVSACFSLKVIEQSVAKWFPNLKSAWAYAGFSPSIKQGSTRQIQSFERETRGGGLPEKSDARGSAALWTRESGYLTQDPAKIKLKHLLNQEGLLANRFVNAFNGAAPLDQRLLREYYVLIQRISSHPELPASDKPNVAKHLRYALGLRFWGKITGRFASTYKSQIDAGYAKLGSKPLDFSRITRAQLKAQGPITKGHPDPAVQELRRLLEGLWKFKKDVIPTDWI